VEQGEFRKDELRLIGGKWELFNVATHSVMASVL